MPRPPTTPGTFGNIWHSTVRETPKRVEAGTWLRLPNGKRKKIRRTGKSIAEAERRLKQAVAEYVDAEATDELKPTSTIGRLLDEWINHLDAADRTKEVYESTIRLHIKPSIGDLQINEATTPKLDQFIREVSTAPTAKRCRAILSGAFSLATRYGLVTHNPVRDTSTVKVVKPKPRALSTSEIATFYRAVNFYCTKGEGGPPVQAHALPSVVDFLLGTGVRISEALNVRWNDLRLDEQPPTATIHVTKDGGSERTIQLPEVAVRGIKNQLANRAVSDYVFPTSTGRPLSKSNIERWFRDCRTSWEARHDKWRSDDDLDISWVTPHSFRRTVATLLADQVSLLAASQQLGHADSVVTQHHYLQRPNAGPPVAAVLNEALRGVSPSKNCPKTE